MRRLTINPPLVVSAVALALTAIVALWHLPMVFDAVGTPRPGDDPTGARMDRFLAAHAEDLAAYQDRFDGRSLFFKPQPPSRVTSAPPPPRERPRETEPTGPPPVPRTYGGPSVNFVLGEEVWFHDGETVRVGEEGANGVTVLAADPPWTVRLGYRGGEYDIELFKRTYPGFEDEPAKPRPIPGLVKVEPEADEAGVAPDDDDATRAP